MLSGVCEEAFGLELGFTHFDNIVYGFEEWTDPWTGWEDNWAPVQSSRESLCGRYSLFVSIAVYNVQLLGIMGWWL